MEKIKEPPMKIDGRVMTGDEFVEYIEGKDFGPEWPNRIFLHHTWKPRREDWRGYDTILAMKRYYESLEWTDAQGRVHIGWTAGPHLFIADDGIWLFTDLAEDGVGVRGHNHLSRHVEMVGNYDDKLPSGATLENTIAALGILHVRLGLEPQNLLFHRDYSSKTCPGTAVTKGWVIPQVEDWIAQYHEAKKEKPVRGETMKEVVDQLLQRWVVEGDPQATLFRKARRLGLLGPLSEELTVEIAGQPYTVQFFIDGLIAAAGQEHKARRISDAERKKYPWDWKIGPFP
ncbi:MAG: N-acetylmuramoyl-L-alanine amidase [Anaerolineae bacterium]